MVLSNISLSLEVNQFTFVQQCLRVRRKTSGSCCYLRLVPLLYQLGVNLQKRVVFSLRKINRVVFSLRKNDRVDFSQRKINRVVFSQRKNDRVVFSQRNIDPVAFSLRKNDPGREFATGSFSRCEKTTRKTVTTTP